MLLAGYPGHTPRVLSWHQWHFSRQCFSLVLALSKPCHAAGSALSRMVLCSVSDLALLLSFVSWEYELGVFLVAWKRELSCRSCAESGGMGALQAPEGSWEIP